MSATAKDAPTQETDRAQFAAIPDAGRGSRFVVEADFARKLERERDAARAALRWIPVSERLPEEGEPVLVALPDDNGLLAVGMDAIGYGGWLNDGITHWMPLPSTP